MARRHALGRAGIIHTVGSQRNRAETSGSRHLIWGAAVPPDGACLQPDGLAGFDAATLRHGRSLAHRFPKDATYRLIPDSNGALPDNLSNSDGQVVISLRLREFLDKQKVTNVELLPVRIGDAGGKILATYFIAHPVRLQLTAWDSAASECTWKDHRVVKIERLVIDAERLQRPGSLFRVHIVDRPVFVARALAGKISAAGFTGLRFVEIDDYRLAEDAAPGLEQLRADYDKVRRLDDFDRHGAFIERLKRSHAPEVLTFHFGLLDDQRNRRFYQRIRAAFAERGDAAEAFLIERLRSKPTARTLADILLLLGTMRSSAALPVARELCTAPDPELRRRAGYVLGWVGEARDLDLLFALSRDPEIGVRETAASAHTQVWHRLPETKQRLIENLTSVLAGERDPRVLGTVVLELQELVGEKLGLRWDEDEGEIAGDVARAVDKARRVLHLKDGPAVRPSCR